MAVVFANEVVQVSFVKEFVAVNPVKEAGKRDESESGRESKNEAVFSEETLRAHKFDD
jgi:hypothetical protein